MKQPRYVTTFSLIVALTGLSPVMAADAGRISDGDAKQAINPKQPRVVSEKPSHTFKWTIYGAYRDGVTKCPHIRGYVSEWQWRTGCISCRYLYTVLCRMDAGRYMMRNNLVSQISPTTFDGTESVD